MKITVGSKALVDAIAWATKTFDTKDSQASVDLVVNADGTAALSHLNGTSFLKAPLTVDSVDLGDKDVVTLALSGQVLTRVGSSLEGSGLVTLKRDAKPTSPLEVIPARGKFTVPIFGTNVRSAPTFTKVGEADEHEYFDSIKRLGTVCDSANATSAPILGAVDVQFTENDQILMMATDRFVMSEYTIPFTVEEGADLESVAHVILPQDTTNKVNAGNPGDVVSFIKEDGSGSKFGYKFADGRVALFAHLGNEEPIAYTTVKEIVLQGIENNVTVNSKDLKSAIGIISNLAWAETNVTLEISEKNGVVVTDRFGNNRLDVSVENLDLDDEEETIKVVFNRITINKVFNTISTSKVRLRWSSPEKAFVFDSIMDNGKVVESAFTFAQPNIDD